MNPFKALAAVDPNAPQTPIAWGWFIAETLAAFVPIAGVIWAVWTILPH